MKSHLDFVDQMVSKGGPEPFEYGLFTEWVRCVADDVRESRLAERDVNVLRSAFGEALSTATVQGFALCKPHGYAGDYEIIEKIYQKSISTAAHLRNWDLFIHVQSAPRAVRNRKRYFKRLLRCLEALYEQRDALRVLNVASGPARDVYEFLRDNHGNIHFDCVEQDEDAIDYATNLCASLLDRVTFIQVNALRMRTKRRYQLIWSAGLFDYFNDKVFKFMLKRLLTFLDEGGELVIGNCSERNPTRDHMEILCDWHIFHRSAGKLAQLARECGAAEGDIYVDQESEGVNLFLHVKRGDEFISFGIQ
jgi:extracellular factor (EF) 3-hydroxypalmitic acid methyl ester biosynthesis protein